MKSYNYILTILLVILIFQQKTFAQSVEEQLIGEWVFDYDTSILDIDAKAQAYLDKMKQNPARIKRLEDTYKGKIIKFISDGVYVQEQRDGRISNSTWSLKNKETIEVLHSKSIISYKIIRLTSDELIIKSITKIGYGRSLFASCHYKRQI